MENYTDSQQIRRSSDINFAKYGKQFQETIFQGLLTDFTWASQMSEVMDPSYFDVKYLTFLAERYFSYFTKYRTFPTLGLLATIVKEDLAAGSETDLILRDQIVEFLHRVKSNPNLADLQYVKDKSLDFCKRQAFKDALQQAVELISTDKFESVVGLMKNAVAVGMPNSVGHDFFDDMEARFVKQRRIVCPTGFAKLDSKEIFQGGLGRGEIGVITANTGVGKSHFLVALGANAMRAGKNVLHYTFELSETNVGLRYDSNLCGMNSNEVQDNKDIVKAKYKEQDLGRLIIKEFPTGSASVLTLRNHIEKLSMKGFVPGVIMVDYADVMRSTRSYDSMRHELKLIYEELRNMSMELNVPIWTASQANRDSANSNIVGLENMSEAYGKAMVADVVLSVSRKAVEKATGVARLFVAKNRAGKDGILFPIHIDTGQSKIEILDENQLTLGEAVSQDSSDTKNLLRKKWNELNSAE